MWYRGLSRIALATTLAASAYLATDAQARNLLATRWLEHDGRMRLSPRSTTAHLAVDSLPRDPALRTGALPNQMRYYVRENKSPAKRAFLYLVVNAGSIQEDDDQRGFAHFLEHMAFNGTKHFPRHELLDYLQLSGMRFGADINASTSYDETIYQLEVPTDDSKSLQQGLTMLHDWANGGMLLDSLEIVAERGVVMGEWRSRLPDTLTQQFLERRDSVLYGAESRYRTRSPIGLTKLLSTAEPAPIRRFYKDWYRPDLMAVVAVGDFDASEVEREIRARFGGIPRVDNPRPRVSPRLPSHEKPIVDVFRGFVNPNITVLWKHEQRVVTTQREYRQELVEQLLFDHLQRRLQRLSVAPRRPFIGGAVGPTALPVRGSAAYMLSVVGWPTDSLEHGFVAILSEIERVVQHGIPAATLERQKASLLRRYASLAQQQSGLSSERYVASYVNDYLQGARGGDALMSPTQQYTLASTLLPTISARDIAAAAQFWRQSADRLTLVQFPKFAHERVPDAARINALFDSVTTLTLAALPETAVDETPLLAKLPTPGRIVKEEQSGRSGVITWTLSNGARVLFKATTNNPDEIIIRAVSAGGAAMLPDTLFFSPGRMVDQMMTQAAGLGSRDRLGLQDQLATTVLRDFHVAITPAEESIALNGSPTDLTTIFQMLYLQFTAPKLDTTALNAWKQAGSPSNHSQDDYINGMLSRGNPRLSPPVYGTMPLADTGRALAVFRDRFGNAGDFTFIIVGAATVQQIKPLVEQYLATLPDDGRRETPPDLGVLPWDRVARTTRRLFDVPKSNTLLFFDGTFPSGPSEYLVERRRLSALSWALQLKFTELMREQMGGTYGVGVSAYTTPVPQEHYRFQISFDGAPERIDGMIDTMFLVLDSVRAHGATPKELQKIAAMQRRGQESSLQQNRYWVHTLALFDRLKIPFDHILNPAQPTTAEEIRMAAQRYLPNDAYLHITTLPSDSTIYMKRDSAQTPASEGRHTKRSGNAGRMDGFKVRKRGTPPI